MYKNTEKQSVHGVHVCWETMLKMLVSKQSYLLCKMVPASAVGCMDYSWSKIRLKETSHEAIALV